MSLLDEIKHFEGEKGIKGKVSYVE